MAETPIEIRIRRAEPADAGALAEVLRSIGWFSRIQNERPDMTLRFVARALDACLADTSHSIHVAVDAHDAVVGYLSIHWLPYLFRAGPEGYISELFVAEPARGRGVGRLLLAAAESEARDRGCSRMQLLNFRTRESYQRGFYEKAGWTERPDGASFVLDLKE